MKLTLCGSARFEAEFKKWNRDLTLAGHTVYTLAVYPSDAGGKDWYTDEQKSVLDGVHMAKIANSDAIVVLNPGGYVGESTRREIDFAYAAGKRIYALHSLDRFHNHRAVLLLSQAQPWSERIPEPGPLRDTLNRAYLERFNRDARKTTEERAAALRAVRAEKEQMG